MSDYEFHEAAEIFPLMDDTALADLADDIEKRGLEIPVEAFEGKILDGRNRFLACELKDIEPDVIDVDPDDPVAYVISMNLHRRHLDPGQRAMAADRAREFYAEQAKERQKRKPKSVPANLPEQNKGDTRDNAGEAFGVSGKSVDDARTVRTKGSKALEAAVDAGKVAVSKAAKVAQLPKQEQTEAVKAGPGAINAAAKKADALKATVGLPDGKTPHQEADEDAARRWSASLHKLYVLLNSTRDLGGIKKLAGEWPADKKREFRAELNRIIGELQKWTKILEK